MMRCFAVAVFILTAGTALAQTRLVPLRWNDAGVYDTGHAIWRDGVTGVIWIGGTRTAEGHNPAAWTIDPSGTVHDVPGTPPPGETRVSFGTFSPNGDYLTLHAADGDPLDDIVVLREDWSAQIAFPSDRPGNYTYRIEAVGNQGQVCGLGEPFAPLTGAFFARPLLGELSVQWLDDVPDGIWAPLVFSMSGDGGVLSGYTFDGLGYLQPLKWTENGGVYALNVLAHPEWTDAIAGRVSPSGRFVAGSVTTFDPQLCVWDEGVPHLFESGGLPFYAHPRWVLDDGTIFGWTWTTPQRAFIANAELLPEPMLLEDYYMFYAGEGFPEPGESWVGQAFLGGGSYHVIFQVDSGRTYYLSVPALGPVCAPDLTGDGILDFFDVQMFLQLFAAQDTRADFTNDGLFNFFDVQAFLSAFAAGCA